MQLQLDVPPSYGLFSRPGEQLRTCLAGERGEMVYECPVGRLAALSAATREEEHPVLRGGLYAYYRLSQAPVTIDGLDIFGAQACCRHTEVERGSAATVLAQELPEVRGTWGHIAVDYHRFLSCGINGLLYEIEHYEAAAADLPEARRREADLFYRSVRKGFAAMLDYAARYRQEALRQAAAATDSGRQAELQRIADALAHVPAEPAASFFEAVQSLLLCHFALHLVELTTHAFGRLDYLLHDFYERDRVRGSVKREEAAEWMQVILVKSSELVGLGDGLGVGGCRPDGTPFWNDLTYFILDAARALRHYQPQIIFRYAPGMPDSLLARAFAPLRDGVPQPGFFNDAVCIPALTRAGFQLEDAREYVVCNCAELSAAGRSNILSGYLYHNLAKPIEVLLNRGEPVVPETHWTAWPSLAVPAEMDYTFSTFDDFQEEYRRYLAVLLRRVAEQTWQLQSNGTGVLPTLSSALLAGCLEQGRTAFEGGARYNHTFPNFTGLVTAADSLTAIRQCIYEDQYTTLDELATACRMNFVEHEAVRQYLLHKCPKFGNNDPRADSMVQWLFDVMADELHALTNRFGVPLAPCYFGEMQYGPQADGTGATPDGRRHGDAITPTLGGDQGRDCAGLTALLLSAVSFDHTRASGGLAVNIALNHEVLQREDDMEKVISLLQTFFSMGGMQAQFNCVSAAQLEQAQQHPGEHRNLLVRVAGFSGYFVDQLPAIQQQIITRVAHHIS